MKRGRGSLLFLKGKRTDDNGIARETQELLEGFFLLKGFY